MVNNIDHILISLTNFCFNGESAKKSLMYILGWQDGYHVESFLLHLEAPDDNWDKS